MRMEAGADEPVSGVCLDESRRSVRVAMFKLGLPPAGLMLVILVIQYCVRPRDYRLALHT
jgi:hypothetical protein